MTYLSCTFALINPCGLNKIRPLNAVCFPPQETSELARSQVHPVTNLKPGEGAAIMVSLTSLRATSPPSWRKPIRAAGAVKNSLNLISTSSHEAAASRVKDVRSLQICVNNKIADKYPGDR